MAACDESGGEVNFVLGGGQADRPLCADLSWVGDGLCAGEQRLGSIQGLSQGTRKTHACFRRSMVAMQSKTFECVCKFCVAYGSVQKNSTRIQCLSQTSMSARKRQQDNMQFKAMGMGVWGAPV